VVILRRIFAQKNPPFKLRRAQTKLNAGPHHIALTVGFSYSGVPGVDKMCSACFPPRVPPGWILWVQSGSGTYVLSIERSMHTFTLGPTRRAQKARQHDPNHIKPVPMARGTQKKTTLAAYKSIGTIIVTPRRYRGYSEPTKSQNSPGQHSKAVAEPL
jgi:hypothetical protein